MGHADWRLALPTVLWFCRLPLLPAPLRAAHARPRQDESELRSQVMGRVVDSYTNILTVAVRPGPRRDAYVREVIDEHTAAIAAHMRLITTFMATLSTMNALLLVGTATIGIALWGRGGRRGRRRDCAASGLEIANVAGWVSWEVTGHLREHRRRAGGHGDHRGPAPLVDRTGARARGDARRDRLRAPDVHLRPQRRAGGARRPEPRRDPPGERVGVSSAVRVRASPRS